MSETEFIEVSYKRFRSENSDGTGKILVLENKNIKAKFSDESSEAQEVRELYREVKKAIN